MEMLIVAGIWHQALGANQAFAYYSLLTDTLHKNATKSNLQRQGIVRLY